MSRLPLRNYWYAVFDGNWDIIQVGNNYELGFNTFKNNSKLFCFARYKENLGYFFDIKKNLTNKSTNESLLLYRVIIVVCFLTIFVKI